MAGYGDKTVYRDIIRALSFKIAGNLSCKLSHNLSKCTVSSPRIVIICEFLEQYN